MVEIVQIGTGAWGQRYLQTWKNFNVNLSIGTRQTWQKLLDQRPAGVAIVTHPDSHFTIAQYALELGIPVMMEKPVSFKIEEVEALSKYNIPILINHIHLFSNEYQRIKQNRSPDQIYLEIGNYTKDRFYSDLWDYGAHAFSIILDLWKAKFEDIRIISHENYPNHWYTRLKFGERTAMAFYGNRFLEKKCYVDAYHLGQFSTYDSVLNPGNPLPLQNAMNIFLDAIQGKKDDRLGVELALEVTKILRWLEWTSPS